MRIFKFKFIVLTALLLTVNFISATKPYSVWMADSEMKRYPESWMVDF